MRGDVGRKPEDADYGLGEHSIDCDGLGILDEQELTERLVKAFEAPNYRPPRLPTVAVDLLALSKNPDVDFGDLEKLLEQDAMLAGEILSLSRSVFYSGVRQVASLREALVRLGLEKLRQVVLQVALNMRVFRSLSYRGCMERLRDHCRATAHLARILSHYTPIAEEQAFLCGLLHDVGIAGILLVLGDTERGKQPPDLAVLWPAIDAAHTRAGSRMVTLWGLPPEVAMVVGAHHQVSIEGFDHPVAATVCLAESLAVEMQMGFMPDPAADGDDTGLANHGRIDQSDPRALQRAQDALGLTESTLELIRADARKWLESEAAKNSV